MTHFPTYSSCRYCFCTKTLRHFNIKDRIYIPWLHSLTLNKYSFLLFEPCRHGKIGGHEYVLCNDKESQKISSHIETSKSLFKTNKLAGFYIWMTRFLLEKDCQFLLKSLAKGALSSNTVSRD